MIGRFSGAQPLIPADPTRQPSRWRKAQRRPRRRLRIETLEQRRLLAAQINELMVDPLFTDNNVGQYLELRAEPSSTLDEGTYFVVVEERALSGAAGPGEIRAVLDLSGLQVGDNGLLVITQQNSPYRLSEFIGQDDPGPAVLQSTAAGFSGLPDDRFRHVDGQHRRFNEFSQASGYMLIHSDTPPELGQDIDANNNGMIDDDGPAADWTIFDSISLHPWIRPGEFAYSQIVFVEERPGEQRQVFAGEGVEVIHGPGFGYAARIGDSTGYTLDDWLSGTVRTIGEGNQQQFRLELGIFGTPVPPAFSGRFLDNLGETNYIGAIRGRVVEEIEDAAGEVTTVPMAGVSVLADTDGNGRRNTRSFSANPALFPQAEELNHAFPGVTLRAVGRDDQSFATAITGRRPAGSPFTVFTDGGVPFFNDARRLRADFYRPVKAVSIDVIGGPGVDRTIGRLEAYDADGNLLRVVRTSPLVLNGRQTLTIERDDDQIAYAIAYSDNNADNFGPGESPSTPFGRLGRMAFHQFEASSVTDDHGQFTLGFLQPGDYDVVVHGLAEVVLRDDISTVPVRIDRYENHQVEFVVRRNTPPTIEPQAFAIEENVPAGTLIGTVVAFDPDPGQTLTFAIEDADESPVSIDAQTGDLLVRLPDVFDFERDPRIEVTVTVTDSAGESASAPIVVNLIDVPEAPVVTVSHLQVSEDAPAGVPVGRLLAFDPDDPEGPVFFQIVGGSGASAFAISQTTGRITVAKPELIRFDQIPNLTLVVEVSDTGDPPMVTTVEVMITVLDANDPPVILTESLEISEDAPVGSVVGQVEFHDPDIGQVHTFRIRGSAGPFGIDRHSGVVTLQAPLNFVAQPQHEIRVLIVDNGVPPMGEEKTIQINVLPSDVGAVLVQSAFHVEAGSAAGSPVGQLQVDGPPEVEFTYRSTDPAAPLRLFDGLVALDGSSGALTVAPGAEIDPQTGPLQIADSFQLLRAGSPVAVFDIWLNVSDVNLPPEILSQLLLIPEGLPSGRPFTVIEVLDPQGDDVVLALVGDDSERFAIVESNRLMVLPGVEIDFDADPPPTVTIQATGARGLQSQAVIPLGRGEPLRFGAEISDVTARTGQQLNFALPAEYRAGNIRSLSLQLPDGGLPDGINFDTASARLTGLPLPQPEIDLSLDIDVVVDDGDADILMRQSFQLSLRHSDTPLHNAVNPLDVDGNGRVEPRDALLVLNVLRQRGSVDARELADSVPVFADTDGNNLIEPADALRVLNEIARQRRSVAGEAAVGAGGVPIGVPVDDEAEHDSALLQLLDEPALF